MVTHFRLAVLAAIALGAVWAGQASAFWPWGKPARITFQPTYSGVCEDCDLSGRILVGARMTNSLFNRSNFSRAVMTRANASRSEFEDANFTGADLRFVQFTEADVTHAVFTGADIAGADLQTAHGLTQTQLNDACGDVRTKLPRGLRVRSCE